MPIPDDIQDFIEKQIKLMISQTEAYLPFIKVAYPYSKNLADACYNLIVGSAVSIFVNQYAMRMKYPTAEDFAEFGKITVKYRDQIDQFFKWLFNFDFMTKVAFGVVIVNLPLLNLATVFLLSIFLGSVKVVGIITATDLAKQLAIST